MKTAFLIFTVLSINTYAQNRQSESITYGNNPQAGRYALSEGAKIYYEVYGKGKPFVLLHGGIMGSIDEMGQFIDSLSKTYQVIAVSTRGHGKSEIGLTQLSYEQKVNDVITIINAVTKDSVTVLGFSDGAYTAYKLASMYPSRIKKLIAIGAGEQVPGLRKVILDAKTTFERDNVYWKKRLALYPEPDRIPEYWKQYEKFYNSMTVSKSLFASIRCPVLVMSGELDQNAPLATVIAAYQMIPNSQLSIIPNAGHVVFFQNFPAVWASITPFIKE